MCGIVGFLSKKINYDLPAVLLNMTHALIHRGPDSAGTYFDKYDGIYLGHRRLSIIDTTNSGRQPMTSLSGRFILIYNGEIYNHLSLRKLLPSCQWRGGSDTETLLNCIENWGIARTLAQCVGMFVFAVWDTYSKSLVIARDRMGEKPLYYGWQGDDFLFASELKSICRHPSFEGRIERKAIEDYLQYSYIPTPLSIYSNIYKLPAGTMIELIYNGSTWKQTQPEQYWKIEDMLLKSSVSRYSGSFAEAQSTLENILKNSIGMQMNADVPVGAFLSGGIDSSLIVALMQQTSSSQINTYTVGFAENSYNEAIFAKKIAEHLGTNHSELYVTPSDALSLIPNICKIYDEPFADSSQIPTILISKFCSESVKVSLSGDGGDELFGGYNRHQFIPKILGLTKKIPSQLLRLLSYLLGAFHSKNSSEIIQKLNLFPKELVNIPHLHNKLYKLSNLIKFNNLNDMYYASIQCYGQAEDLLVMDSRHVHKSESILNMQFLSTHEMIMCMDLKHYLADDILVKLDRASMSAGLEARTPFLDVDVIEFAYNIPINYKITDGQTKYILRQILGKFIPPKLFQRPKMGFGIPLDDWLCGPLKPLVTELLDDHQIRKQGYFNHKVTSRIWKDHLTGKAYNADIIWNLLIFQLWINEYEFNKIQFPRGLHS